MYVIDRLTHRLDELLPATEETAGIHRTLGALTLTGAIASAEQIIEQVENSNIPAERPFLFLGSLAATSFTTAAASYFWSRSWKSQGE